MPGVLTGINVIDFGHFVAGPFTSTLLGDLGATVVKVESLEGDRLRNVKSASFAASNRGKLSLAIDLKDPIGRAAFERGCDWADVVHHNFRPGAAARLGVEGDALRKERPDLVVLEASAYGAEGPSSQRGGFDILLQALTGHLDYLGGESGAPIADRVLQVDYGTGMVAALAIVSALLRKRRGGGGASLEISLLDTAAFLMAEMVRRPDGSVVGPRPVNTGLTGRGPAERMYQAADGWLAVVALGDEAATALVSTLGIAPFVRGVSGWGEEEAAAIAAAIASRSVAELAGALRAAGVWCEPSPRDARSTLLRDPVLAGRGSVVVDHDPVYGEKLDIGLGTCATGDFDSSGRGHLDILGEHSRHVLGLWGLSEGEIDKLYAAGTVR